MQVHPCAGTAARTQALELSGHCKEKDADTMRRRAKEGKTDVTSGCDGEKKAAYDKTPASVRRRGF